VILVELGKDLKVDLRAGGLLLGLVWLVVFFCFVFFFFLMG